MRAMTSRQIHDAIDAALHEVAHALASGEIDHSGRFYSPAKLNEQLETRKISNVRRRLRDHKSPGFTTKSA